MKVLILFILIYPLFDAGCYQRTQKDTVELKCHLYVENVEVNRFGVDEVYLTDSSRFRIFVGKHDVEHERFSFECNDDSVTIFKGIKNRGHYRDVDSLSLSREDLRNNKIDSTKPLFEFK